MEASTKYMLENYIIFGIEIYFAGLILSALLAFLNKSFKSGTKLFIFSNGIGFLSIIFYFLFFSKETLVLAQFNWFFEFTPRLNFLSALFFAIISGVSCLVGIYSLRYLELYKNDYSPHTVQCLMSGFVLGMQGVLLSNNAFVFLLFWEVMSIASFFLVFSDKKEESIKAAFTYFIMTHLGASAILGGFLILGQGTLIFNLDNITIASQNLSPNFSNLAFLLFVFGFGSKAGLVPFHVWLPEAHPQAPSNISAMMSGLMLKVSVYGFIMIILNFVNIPGWAGLIVLFLGILSGMVGVLYAVVERDMKKAFAYSSIENMGIIFTMLGLAIYLLSFGNYQIVAYSIIAFAIFHALNHALFKSALFLSSGIIINRVHTKSLEMMGGIAKLMPIFSLAFLLAILGSLPLPLFGTFYGEWGLIRNSLTLMGESSVSSNTVILLLAVISFVAMISGLAIFAMVKIFGISMLGLPHNPHMEKRNERADFLLIVPVLFLAGGVIVFGFLAKFIIFHITNYLQTVNFYSAHTITSPMDISSFWISGAIIFTGLVVYIFQKILLKNKKERSYHTWDCGQPIDATMQYSATAFSAPIRFFFLSFIGRKKSMQSTPIVETNPWIRKYNFELSIRSTWNDALYAPIAKSLHFMAEKIRFIQNGRIQYYILFLLGALIITLIFAL
ncbi:MAG: proton-conducting transporter membrane subunit [bacterium]|nr:proton-conducting transporter membrane subunit [bacterium]